MGTAKLALAALAMVVITHGGASAGERFGFGRPAAPEEVAGWNIDILTDGQNLPQGSGTAAHGRELFAAKCAMCHGAEGEGGMADRLVGGAGTLGSRKPVKTVGSYWPYATTLFDYIRRAMPLNAPQSLANDEIYALSAYILSLNEIVPKDATLDAKSLAQVKMPNRDHFFVDRRPDAKNEPCMKDCGYKAPAATP